ncbi:MAG: helix-turn-helix transcriptional regulator [Verrucomicrobiota bacterium]
MHRTITVLRQAASQKDWTMSDLARAAGMYPAQLSKVARGRALSPEMLQRVLRLWPQSIQTEIAMAWITDLLEEAGVDPTTIAIRPAETVVSGLGDDLTVINEMMTEEPDLSAMIRRMADMARESRGRTWDRPLQAAEDPIPYPAKPKKNTGQTQNQGRPPTSSDPIPGPDQTA